MSQYLNKTSPPPITSYVPNVPTPPLEPIANPNRTVADYIEIMQEQVATVLREQFGLEVRKRAHNTKSHISSIMTQSHTHVVLRFLIL